MSYWGTIHNMTLSTSLEKISITILLYFILFLFLEIFFLTKCLFKQSSKLHLAFLRQEMPLKMLCKIRKIKNLKNMHFKKYINK